MDQAERERTGWPTTKAERQFRHLAVNNFTEWPCERRVAHKAGHCSQPDCPGVRTHPATMIGRG